jgi:RimJ/RimL family protein N-acetyltransferase
VGLHEIDFDSHTARIGEIIFNPKDRGHHYGSEAMNEMLRYGFMELGLNKIYANVLLSSPDNIARDAHLGFVQEAVLKEAYLLRGEYLDMAHMTMVKKDWLTRRKT